jgi:hypothetical protein
MGAEEECNAEAYAIFPLEKYTMAQTFAGATRFSADVNVSKNRKYWGIPASFQILSKKENEAETKWRSNSRSNRRYPFGEIDREGRRSEIITTSRDLNPPLQRTRNG